MAEASFKSYDIVYGGRQTTSSSDVLDNAKKMTKKTGKRIKSYYTIGQERVRESVYSFQGGFAQGDGCLGFLGIRRSGKKYPDDDEPLESSRLLPRPENLTSEINQDAKPKLFQRVARTITSKVGGAFKKAGAWIVHGLQNYADAVHPQMAFAHDNYIHMYPYVS